MTEREPDVATCATPEKHPTVNCHGRTVPLPRPQVSTHPPPVVAGLPTAPLPRPKVSTPPLATARLSTAGLHTNAKRRPRGRRDGAVGDWTGWHWRLARQWVFPCVRRHWQTSCQCHPTIPPSSREGSAGVATRLGPHTYGDTIPCRRRWHTGFFTPQPQYVIARSPRRSDLPLESTSGGLQRGHPMLTARTPFLRWYCGAEIASQAAKKRAVLVAIVNRLRRGMTGTDRKMGTVHALGDSLGTVPVLLREIRYVGGFFVHGPAPRRSWLAMTRDLSLTARTPANDGHLRSQAWRGRKPRHSFDRRSPHKREEETSRPARWRGRRPAITGNRWMLCAGHADVPVVCSLLSERSVRRQHGEDGTEEDTDPGEG